MSLVDAGCEGLSGRIVEVVPLPVERWALAPKGGKYANQNIGKLVGTGPLCPRCGERKAAETSRTCQACAVELGVYRRRRGGWQRTTHTRFTAWEWMGPWSVE